MKTPRFEVSRRGKVPIIDFKGPLSPGSRVSILAQADEHFDNVHAQQDKIRSHMQEAVDNGWPIVKLGDSLCLMGGTGDRRADKSDLRPEHKSGDYIDAVVNDYAQFCSFAAPNIALIAPGNHELSIKTRCETDVIERIAEQWRQIGSPVHVGGIGGWILVRINVTATATFMVPIFYHPGHGGGGMGRGTGHANKRALYLPDAQVVISGHIHEEWVQTICRDRINLKTARTFIDESTHVVTGTYKQEYLPHESTWHCKNGRPPKPIGGTWLDLVIRKEWDERTKSGKTARLPRYCATVDIRRAK